MNNLLFENTSKSEPIKITFIGDIMLDRWIRRKAIENKGYDFILEDLTEQLNTSDLVVGNLEGPVSSYDSISMDSEIGSTKNYLFTFSPESLDLLKKNNITLVNLGNNHILNFGKSALAETYDHLSERDIHFFGNTGLGKETLQRFIVKEIEGIKVGFVNYNQFVTDGKTAVVEDLEQARTQADIVILYTHWGNEYVQENQVIKDLAYELIDAGADVIIGSHPHVIQGVEEYKGKKIYYSLGNFIFDQYFSEEVMTGLVVEMVVDQETLELSFDEFEVELNRDGRTILK